MKIFGTNISIAKDPKTSQMSWRGGDVLILSPLGHMLKKPWTKVLLQFYCPLPILPFFSCKKGSKGLYIGFKGVGWDDTYTNWMPKNSGDFLIFTFRLFSDG